MATGPYWNVKRGTWSVQYWDGAVKRVVVVKRRRGWKQGDPQPRKAPPEAFAELLKYQAIEDEAKQWRDRTAGKQPDTLADFLNAHATSYSNAETRERVTRAVAHFIAWCAGRKILRVGQVKPDDCEMWLKAALSDYEPSTVATMRRYIAAAWTRRGRNRSAPNPWRDARPEAELGRKRRGSWTPEQFERLLAACKHQALRDLLIAGVQTGLRISALIRLEWSEIEPVSPDAAGYGWIRLPAAKDKAGKGYDIPISKKLHEVLERRRSSPQAHPKYFMTGRHGRPYWNRSHTAKLIQLACVRAGLPDPDSPNHHLRRTFGRWAVAGHLTGRPVPLYIISRWLGHCVVRTTMIYLDVSEDDSTRFMLGDA